MPDIMPGIKKRSLLLVEDEAIIALSQKSVLEKYGYKVITANSGEKAIKLIKENHDIELILMDIDLGEGIDGTETARIILNVRTIPIVFLSSHTEPQVVEKTEEITSYGYVVKNTGITVLDTSIKMAFKLFEAHCNLYSQNMEIEAIYEEMQAANEELETSNEDLIQSQNDIVEHAKVLHESERKYRDIYNNAVEGIFQTTPEGKLIGANHAYAATFGFDSPESILKEVNDIGYQLYARSEDRERLKVLISEQSRVVNFEVEARTRKGEVIWVSINASELLDDNGVLKYITGTTIDITERKLAVELLRESENRYNQLAEQNLTFAWEVDNNGLYTYASHVSELILGYKPEELVGRKYFYDLCPEDERESLKSEVFAAFGRHESFVGLENLMLSKDGRIITVSTNAIPLFDSEGSLCGYRGLDTDISEKIKTRHALKESELRYRTLIENAGQAIVVARNGIIIFANPITSVLLGYSLEEIYSRPFIEFIYHQDREMVMEHHRERLAGNIDNKSLYIFRSLTKEGKIQWFEINAVKIDWDGEIATLNFLTDINERKKAEDSLRENELFKSRLMEYIPVPVFYKDINGLYQGFNSAYEDFFGVRKEELLGKTVFDINPEELAGIYHEKDKDLLNNRGTQVYESQVKNGKSEIRDVVFHKAALTDITGDITGIVGVILDITERKFFVDLLRESEERYRQLFSHSPLGIYIADREGNILDANERLLDILGSPSLEATKKINVLTLPVLAENGYTDKFRECFDRNTIVQLELFYTSQWGKTTYLSNYIVPVVNAAGEVIEVFTLMEDISKRKQAEKELRETKDYLENLLNYANAPIIVWDTKLKITRFNQAFEKLSGRSASEVIGKGVDILFPPDGRDQSIKFINNANEGNRWELVEIEIQHIDGSIYTLLWNSAPIYSLDNKTLIATIAQGQNITIRKQAEIKIQELLHEKEIILQEVHHRMKNNMNTIKGLLILQSESIKDQSAKTAFLDAQNRVHSMMLLYDKLYKSADFDEVSVLNYLPDLVDEIVENFPNRKSVKIIKNIDDFVLDVKKLQPLGIIINELLTNIMKYAFPGRGDCLITVSVSLADKQAVIVIQDNGIGIPESVSFENSTGFGMQLVGMLTEQIAGSIKIERGEGTRFVLEFEIY